MLAVKTKKTTDCLLKRPSFAVLIRQLKAGVSTVAAFPPKEWNEFEVIKSHLLLPSPAGCDVANERSEEKARQYAPCLSSLGRAQVG